MRACQLGDAGLDLAHDRGHQLGALFGGDVLPPRLLPQLHHLLDEVEVLVLARLARSIQLLALLAAGGGAGVRVSGDRGRARERRQQERRQAAAVQTSGVPNPPCRCAPRLIFSGT